MIKLIAMDMDGTLLSPDHKTVADADKEALIKAHEIGIRLAISTGRTLSTIGDICSQIPEIDYIIFSNGAGIYDRKAEAIIYRNNMPPETAEKYLPYIEERSGFIEAYIDGIAYALKRAGRDFDYDLIPPVFRAMFGTGVIVIDDFTKVYGEYGIEKVIFYIADSAVCVEADKYLRSKPEIFVTSSVGRSIEFTKAGTDKGDALRALCEYIYANPEEAMALGDASNDIPMIKAAGFGIAMENADEKTKQEAKYITKANAKNGVAAAIYKYALK